MPLVQFVFCVINFVISNLLQVFLWKEEMCTLKENAGFRLGDVWQG